ncbi:hypothetical protein [Parachryseolinea silvisoli]|jgi:hypothetical protein|nr:hypothetical protein [Parachryseolinea silvisoli]MCD9014153.1 hypothetical protein [Parachryseolinea silvisoli]
MKARMERCDINLLIERTLHLQWDGAVDKEDEIPGAAAVEILKLKR